MYQNIKIIVVFFRVLYSRFPNPGGVLGTWIHMLNLGVVRPTHLSTKSFFQTHPSTNFFSWNQLRCQFLPSNPSIYQNFDLKIKQGAKFCSGTHLSTKIWRSNPSIYQNFTIFWGKWPTHLSTLAFQTPSFYIDHTHPWKYVIPYPPGFPNNLAYYAILQNSSNLWFQGD